MTGKSKLMVGAAAIAILAAASTAQAATTTSTQSTSAPAPTSGYMVVAQADAPPSNAELTQRLDALEEEVQSSEVNEAKFENTPPVVPTGWWSNTSISGRMYWDATNIENKNAGHQTAISGTSFDIKRFYLGVDHKFDDVFAANLTTDVTYDSTTAVNQIYIKKAYLQATLDPAFVVRVGSADMPWIPYAEGVYGYRYVENTLIDRIKFGNSADWGIHVLGKLADGIVNYQISAVNGAGYKKAATYRTKGPDIEGRVSVNYQGFQAAVGGYIGHEGLQQSTATPLVGAVHDYQRFDALAAYTMDGIRAGVEFFNAVNKGNELGATPSTHGWGVSPFASYQITPEWGVFGRYDYVKPYAQDVAHKAFHNEYYNLGVSYTPTKIVDISLVYKHDAASNGSIADSNGTIGGTAFAPGSDGTYNEIGIFGDLQW